MRLQPAGRLADCGFSAETDASAAVSEPFVLERDLSRPRFSAPDVCARQTFDVVAIFLEKVRTIGLFRLERIGSWSAL
jgi:hypothetical protein